MADDFSICGFSGCDHTPVAFWRLGQAMRRKAGAVVAPSPLRYYVAFSICVLAWRTTAPVAVPSHAATRWRFAARGKLRRLLTLWPLTFLSGKVDGDTEKALLQSEPHSFRQGLSNVSNGDKGCK
jgi:hypothetical protein